MEMESSENPKFMKKNLFDIFPYEVKSSSPFLISREAYI
jgi:hypothetical protein